MGDNGAVPDPYLDHYLTNVDVLILPIETVLTREVDAILRKYDPKAVIPPHHFVKGLTTAGAGLESPDGWVHEHLFPMFRIIPLFFGAIVRLLHLDQVSCCKTSPSDNKSRC